MKTLIHAGPTPRFSRFATVGGWLLPLLPLMLLACGGGAASLGGTLSGLPASASVVLQNKGANDLTLSANGTFWFSGTLSSGSAYEVTVLSQPVGASCAVTNGSGTIDAYGSDVNSVAVTCTATASVTGSVSGLAAGTSVSLSNNGSLTLAIASNGAFAFPGVLAAGTVYSVTVSTQPVGQTCSVANGSGTVVAGSTTGIVVTCSSP